MPRLTLQVSKKINYNSNWNNLLIWGDPINVMRGLNHSFLDTKFTLIFIDLPFFSMTWKDVKIIHDLSKEKDPSILNRYYDNYFRTIDLEKYLDTIEIQLSLAKELLSSDGFICIRVNTTETAHIKVLLDNIFGLNCFVNEIITNSDRIITNNRNIDLIDVTNKILVYSLAKSPRIDPVYDNKKSGGYWHAMDSGGQGSPKKFTVDGKELILSPPPGTHWKFKQKTIDEYCASGKIKLNSVGKPVYWVDEKEGQIISNNWLDINSSQVNEYEQLEKSSIFVERLIRTFSNEEDFVADFSCQYGEFLHIAEKLNRKWIGSDLSKYSIIRCAERLEKLESSFYICNAGLYQKSLFKTGKKTDFVKFHNFILQVMQAKPVSGFQYFHGIQGNSLISVAQIDEVIDVYNLHMLIEEFEEWGKSSKFIIVAQDFSFDEPFNELLNTIKDQKTIAVNLLKFTDLINQKDCVIQPQLLDAPDVQFKFTKEGNKVTFEIKDFFFLNIDNLNYEMIQEISKIDKNASFIDFWTIAWNKKESKCLFDEYFYRAENTDLPLKTSHTFSEEGKYTIHVKIVDLMGNELDIIEEINI